MSNLFSVNEDGWGTRVDTDMAHYFAVDSKKESQRNGFSSCLIYHDVDIHPMEKGDKVCRNCLSRSLKDQKAEDIFELMFSGR